MTKRKQAALAVSVSGGLAVFVGAENNYFFIK